MFCIILCYYNKNKMNGLDLATTKTIPRNRLNRSRECTSLHIDNKATSL